MSTPKRRCGRPEIPANRKAQPINTTFPAEVYATLKTAGKGSASAGVRLAAKRFHDFFTRKNKAKETISGKLSE